MRSGLVSSLSGLAFGLAAAAAAVSAAADQYDRRVELINNTSNTLVEFYASNVGTNDWQEDIFGTDTLGPGGTFVVNIDDGTGYCRYDFLAVFDNGERVENARVNVCEAQSITYE